jgi:hypothetical protein
MYGQSRPPLKRPDTFRAPSNNHTKPIFTTLSAKMTHKELFDERLKTLQRRNPDLTFDQAWQACCATPELSDAVRTMGGTPIAAPRDAPTGISKEAFDARVNEMRADGMTQKEAFDTAMLLPEMNPGTVLTKKQCEAALHAKARELQANGKLTDSQAWEDALKHPLMLQYAAGLSLTTDAWASGVRGAAPRPAWVDALVRNGILSS